MIVDVHIPLKLGVPRGFAFVRFRHADEVDYLIQMNPMIIIGVGGSQWRGPGVPGFPPSSSFNAPSRVSTDRTQPSRVKGKQIGSDPSQSFTQMLARVVKVGLSKTFRKVLVSNKPS